jgi:hypothetical protein
MGNRNVISQATLYQIQTFNANGKRIIASNKLNILNGIQKTNFQKFFKLKYSIKGSQINSNSIEEWNLKMLKIPAVSPSINSALIRVEYFVKVKF